MTKLNILVATGESRTGDSIVQNLLDKSAPCREYTNEVFAILPPQLTNKNLAEVSAKQINIDVHGISEKEIAEQLKSYSVHSVIICPPASAKKAEYVEKLAKAIKELSESNKDLKNVVLISAVGADEAKPNSELKKFKDIEDCATKILKEAKLNHCILRASHYMHSLGLYAKQMKENGFLGLPLEKETVTFVDARDVAAASAVIATGCGEKEMKEGYRGKTFNLTGVEALTGPKIVELMKESNDKLAKELNEGYKSITRQEAEKYLSTVGELDPSEIGVIQDMFELVKEGKVQAVSDDLRNILKVANIEPRTLSEYLKETVDTFLYAKEA